MKLQILFGSQSDDRVFNPLVDLLQPLGQVDVTVASAHRNPEKVRAIVGADQADAFIAGAGLAAHLPGVVASLTQKCVFGIAVNGAFGGLDAFLSIVQMPKDIPVMAVTEGNIKVIGDFLRRLPKIDFETVHLAGAVKEVEKNIGFKVVRCEPDDEGCLGKILTMKDPVPCAGLNLLMLSAEDKVKTERALDFFRIAQSGGLWVGMNNVTNFSLQILKLKELKRILKAN